MLQQLIFVFNLIDNIKQVSRLSGMETIDTFMAGGGLISYYQTIEQLLEAAYLLTLNP